MYKSKKNIFITWAPSNTRSSSLAQALDFHPIYIGKISKHKTSFHALFNYIGRTIENIKILLKEKPNIIAISNFHWIIALVNISVGKFVGSSIILDSHSAAFDHPFHKYPKFLSIYFAKKALFSIVTNEVHKKILTSKGAKAYILPDIPNENELFMRDQPKIDEKFNLCFVCTFNYDEPYYEVFKAVETLKDVTVYVTGNFKNKIKNPGIYKNIIFTGYLPDSDYIKLINQVDAILVLTTRENTMQSGGSEAISVRKPLITSKTNMLQSYFTWGTIFVENNYQSIREGIYKMKEEYDFYLDEIIQLNEKRKFDFLKNIENINKDILAH